jgi:glutathione S-transferase
MKLYFSQGACSLAPHLVLEEIGKPYEAIEVSFDKGDNEKPEFKKLNPTGAIPVLVLDNGQVITENVAILSYLADQKPEAKLLPANGTFERARALEWLSFCSTYVHSSFGAIFGADFMTSTPSGAEELRTKAKERASAHFDQIEQRLAQKKSTWVLGSDYSACDAYLFVFFSWAKHLKFDLSRWPTYAALCSRVAERPASLRVLKAEDLLD